MNVTLCIHRGATPAEVSSLPQGWHDALGGMAGGPVEVLEEINVHGLASASPCESPGHQSLGFAHPELWLPLDCGRCDPCEARMAIECAL